MRPRWVRSIRPPQAFHPMLHAYAVRPGDAEWLATVDAFVARAFRDGRMRGLAAKHGLADLLLP